MTTATLYTTLEACARTGLTRRILTWWVTAGAIHPHQRTDRKRRQRNAYSADNIDRLDAIARVRNDLVALGYDTIPVSLVRDLWDGLDGADATELSHGTVTITVRRGLGDE